VVANAPQLSQEIPVPKTGNLPPSRHSLAEVAKSRQKGKFLRTQPSRQSLKIYAFVSAGRDGKHVELYTSALGNREAIQLACARRYCRPLAVTVTVPATPFSA